MLCYYTKKTISLSNSEENVTIKFQKSLEGVIQSKSCSPGILIYFASITDD